MSKLNCRPGGLAVCVKRCDLSGDYLLGRVFKLTTSHLYFNAVMWEYEGEIVETPWGTLNGVADDNLRPIRDPGDDARDETLEWLPVPTKNTETV
jgi:hypothetical protein